MSGERMGGDESNFIGKKPLTKIEGQNHQNTLLKIPENTRDDMCLYAACLNTDWGDDVSDSHKKWVQNAYDAAKKSEEE